ncbi:NAD(P)-binding protein [Rhodotorula sp. JG-1b]|nr:NAD(P)-binding protein [Rhodotorula sp. JG-1b]
MSHLAGILAGKHFAQKDVPSLVGRKYIVTGGTNGIGLSAARCLYSHGADVTIFGSQQSNADAASEYIRTGNLHAAPKDYQDGFHGLLGEWKDDSADGGQDSGEIHAEVCDFRDLKAVAQLGKKLAERFSDRLDGLLANAGLGVNNFALTKDGYDAHLTINCLAHVVLISHLLPVLEKTSIQHPDADKDVGPQNLYARTKLATILIMKKLVQQYIPPGSKILVHATHPGGVATDESLPLIHP